MPFNSKIFCYIRLNERESKKDEHLNTLNKFLSLNDIEINEIVIEGIGHIGDMIHDILISSLTKKGKLYTIFFQCREVCKVCRQIL